MELTDEQLTQLEEMAAALMQLSDIAILLNIPHNKRDFLCRAARIIDHP